MDTEHWHYESIASSNMTVSRTSSDTSSSVCNHILTPNRLLIAIRDYNLRSTSKSWYLHNTYYVIENQTENKQYHHASQMLAHCTYSKEIHSGQEYYTSRKSRLYFPI